MTRVFGKDVTDAELRERMSRSIALLEADVVPWSSRSDANAPQTDSSYGAREDDKDRKSPSSTLMDSGLPQAPAANAGGLGDAHGAATAAASVTEEEQCFLASIDKHPLLTATGRRDYLGLSSDAANSLRKILVERGFVETIRINLGTARGGLVTFHELTPAGWAILGKRQPWVRPENCSAEHFWWQRQIRDGLVATGRRAELEYSLHGKRADVGLLEADRVTAIEVGLTNASGEATNAVRDLQAGFNAVVIAARTARLRSAIQKRLVAALPENKRVSVKLTTLPELRVVKDLLSRVGPGAGQGS